MENKNLFTIKAVSDQTGLSTFLIRAWENRYKAVNPERTETNRRLYSPKDIEKLNLLHKAVEKGFLIRNIANLSLNELRELDSEKLPVNNYSKPQKIENQDINDVITDAINAINKLDSQELETVLMNAGVDYSQPVLLHQIIVPLMSKIGDMWRKGDIRISHEHLASEVIRNYLMNIIRKYRFDDHSPKLLVATPQGQQHELGALVSAVTAASEGWNVIYLGADLPFLEIAYSVRNFGVKAVLLGIIYPTDDPRLNRELIELSKMLDKEVSILITGQGANYYSDTLNEIGASIINTPNELIRLLDKARNINK